MAIAHDLTTRVALVTAAIALFNGGSGALQKIRFKDGSGNVLASFALGTTPWGAANGTTGISAASLAATTSSVTTAGGVGTTATATTGEVLDKDGNVRMTFAVGTGSSDYNFDAVLWTHGGTVTVSSVGYTLN